MLEVRERNLDAQLFFKTQGFRAVSVLRHHYDDTEEDAYILQFRMQPEEQIIPAQFVPQNRISDYAA
jgi:ribosomal-protein-alanine N-acetyltransferase